MAQYLVLIYDDEDTLAAADPQASDELLAEHRRFASANGTSVRGGNALQPTAAATSIRPDGAGGFSVTDAPFAETKEALVGYYLVDADDLDEAVAIAEQVPTLAGGVEVRPVLTFD
ncbi:YciI family protein [Actinocatenispora sera]|uniref:Transcription initiation protein n=1 Tax=Actinocatenispora sera TaxID=390989 RepID=A0A810L3W7_9ACTN|nr:YciI family protein [Actinocatenispora sera]BCJ30164.1 transcription initiation protein [Actinocatenispora sera]